MLAAVFDDGVTNKRLNYARRVNKLKDRELWFLDESGFNLHIAPSRCWGPKGRATVQAVPTNRGVKVSLLMCIAPDGIVYYEIKKGRSKPPTLLATFKRLLTTAQPSRTEKSAL